jgi:hypothetical protein
MDAPGEELPEPTPEPTPAAGTPPPLPKYPAGPVVPGYPIHSGHQGGPRPVGPPPSKTMAGWSLGLAIFGCSLITWVLGLVFAIQVLVESRRERRDHGTTMAVIALAFLGFWAVVAVVVLASGVLGRLDLTDPMDHADPVDGRRAVPYQLQVADCVDDPRLADLPAEQDTADTGMVTLVRCEESHDLEAFLTAKLAGEEYPSLDDLRQQSVGLCDPAFGAYVGQPAGQSELEYWVYYPTERAWDAPANHRFACVVGAPGREDAGHAQGLPPVEPVLRHRPHQSCGTLLSRTDHGCT